MILDLGQADRSWRDVYRLVISFVNPRPIALVSTVSADGVGNLAPFSFFNMVSANPPVMMFCPSRTRDGGKKDTLANVEATGAFVVATVSQPMVEKMHQASAAYPPEVDEFAAAGFTAIPATRVQPSLVAESPVNCECRLDRIVSYGEEPGAGAVIFGRIEVIHVADEYLLENGTADPARLLTVGRMGGLTYARTTDRFDLPPARVE